MTTESPFFIPLGKLQELVEQMSLNNIDAYLDARTAMHKNWIHPELRKWAQDNAVNAGIIFG